MLDLSNNNPQGSHNFKVAYVKGGQRRVYLKEVEAMNFVDRTYLPMKKKAEAVGFKVGPYDFLHPLDATPREVLNFFLSHAYSITHKHSLRPALDCEYGRPSAKVGRWITEISDLFYEERGYRSVIYGSGWWLQGCNFLKIPGPLWLAAYGRNDGREYPVGKLPHPWTKLAAHQYSSKGRVIGISGECDVSHVFIGSQIDVPKSKK